MRSSIVRIALVVLAVLTVPFVAMQFTDEVVWRLGDFVVAGALMVGAGVAYVVMTRESQTVVHRVAAGAAIGTALVAVWVGLAV